MKTASESQIKELLVNTERKPVDLAEIEKLIKEKNVAGSSKHRKHLEGIRIFFLDGNLSQLISFFTFSVTFSGFFVLSLSLEFE